MCYDALIIGAGILGASVAAHLAENKWKVLVLEKGELASGASSGNIGQLSVSDRCTDAWHMKLAMDSLHYYKETLQPQDDIEFSQSGGSTLLCGAEQIKAGETSLDHLQRHGIRAELYRAQRVNEVEPAILASEEKALLFCPAEGKVNPLLATLALLKKAKRAGASIREHSPVCGFDIENGRIHAVRTQKEIYRANWVVNCAGPHASFVGKMAGVPIPVCYHKGTALVTQPVAPLLHGPVCEGRFLVKTNKRSPKPQRAIGFSTIQTAHGSIILSQSTEIADVNDRAVNMASIHLISKNALQHLPQLHSIQLVRVWAVATSYTKDGLPVFGKSDSLDNFFTVAGFKGAFTVAPQVGHLTALALQGTKTNMLSAFRPDRLICE